MSKLKFTLNTTKETLQIELENSDEVVDYMESIGIPFDEFISVYQDDPTPDVSSGYGAPMGRMSNGMDVEGSVPKADIVELDEGGYDPGGAYWGLRKDGEALFAVQDGFGNLAFFDASSPEHAIELAMNS